RVGQSFYHRAEKLVAMRKGDADWTIRKSNGLLYQMREDPTGRTWLRLSRIEDDNGNCVTVEYDDRGNLAEAVGTDGIRYLFISDDHERIRAIDKMAGEERVRLVNYGYDDHGDLITVTDRSDIPFSYGYRRHLLVRETRRSGLSFHFEWDDLTRGADARCIKTWGDGNIYYRELTYQPEIRQTTVTSLAGATETYRYNEIGIVTEVTTPLGATSVASFNRFGEMEASTDPNGATSRWRHDAYGRIVAFIDKDGATTRYIHANDNPESPSFDAVVSETDPLGIETTASYDARGNLIAYTDASGYTVRILRDQRGLPLNLQDTEGTLSRFSWTRDGNLREQRGSGGGSVSFEYDIFGRLVRETTEGLAPVEYGYDQLDRLTWIVLGDGSSSTMLRDADGRMVELHEPGGAVHRWEYRGLPDPVSRINPDGTSFRYEYDTELNMVRLINEVGDEYRLDYDADQRLIAETGFDGRRQTYTYDPAGNVIRATDGNRVHEFTRDPVGRLLRRDSSDGGWSLFGYDGAGRIVQADNASRKLGFVYDSRGLLLSEMQDGIQTTHAYSPRGERITTLLPDGRFIGFGYDRNGAFDRLSFNGRDILNLRRDRIGREILRNTGSVTQQTDYDPQGRIRRQTGYRDARQQPIFARSYGHNAAGLIGRIKDVARGERSYLYDQREQLRRVTGNREELFDFDPAGNILADAETARDASVRHGRLLMCGDNHYEYDDAGNRISLRRGHAGSHKYSYSYDALNQLTTIHEVRGRTQRVTSFAYDAFGRRISKSHREIIVAANRTGAPDEATEIAELVREDTTWFLWNGDVLLAEGKGDAAGAVDAAAVVYVFEPDSFRPAAQIRRHSPDQNGEVLIYWNDHLGTPQEITNERGELVWQVALKAWGGIDRIFLDRAENNIRFQGQYFDAETGLHYNRFRHYDPAAGCFISQDPIGLSGGEILAGYAPNTTHFVDPFGLTDWDDYRAQHKGTGMTPDQMSAGYRNTPKYINRHSPSAHGNSLSNKPAVLYAITDKDGNFQKWGITQETRNPRNRYSGPRSFDGQKLPANWRIERVAIGTRSEMAALERSLTTVAGGPKNKESWSSFRNGRPSALAGVTDRIRSGDTRFTERQRLAINNALSMGCKF
ncbi:RHS repeat-associated core domain-containing protein, partial [Paracoccus alkanivorans]